MAKLIFKKFSGSWAIEPLTTFPLTFRPVPAWETFWLINSSTVKKYCDVEFIPVVMRYPIAATIKKLPTINLIFF